MHDSITARKIEHGSKTGFESAPIDVAAMRAYRYSRVQHLLLANDCAAALLIDPVNIRYATDTRNMSVWLLHNMGRYCLIPAVGPAVLFEYANKNCLAIRPPGPEIAE